MKKIRKKQNSRTPSSPTLDIWNPADKNQTYSRIGKVDHITTISGISSPAEINSNHQTSKLSAGESIDDPYMDTDILINTMSTINTIPSSNCNTGRLSIVSITQDEPEQKKKSKEKDTPLEKKSPFKYFQNHFHQTSKNIISGQPSIITKRKQPPLKESPMFAGQIHSAASHNLKAGTIHRKNKQEPSIQSPQSNHDPNAKESEKINSSTLQRIMQKIVQHQSTPQNNQQASSHINKQNSINCSNKSYNLKMGVKGDGSRCLVPSKPNNSKIYIDSRVSSKNNLRQPKNKSASRSSSGNTYSIENPNLPLIQYSRDDDSLNEKPLINEGPFTSRSNRSKHQLAGPALTNRREASFQNEDSIQDKTSTFLEKPDEEINNSIVTDSAFGSVQICKEKMLQKLTYYQKNHSNNTIQKQQKNIKLYEKKRKNSSFNESNTNIEKNSISSKDGISVDISGSKLCNPKLQRYLFRTHYFSKDRKYKKQNQHQNYWKQNRTYKRNNSNSNDSTYNNTNEQSTAKSEEEPHTLELPSDQAFSAEYNGLDDQLQFLTFQSNEKINRIRLDTINKNKKKVHFSKDFYSFCYVESLSKIKPKYLNNEPIFKAEKEALIQINRNRENKKLPISKKDILLEREIGRILTTSLEEEEMNESNISENQIKQLIEDNSKLQEDMDNLLKKENIVQFVSLNKNEKLSHNQNCSKDNSFKNQTAKQTYKQNMPQLFQENNPKNRLEFEAKRLSNTNKLSLNSNNRTNFENFEQYEKMIDFDPFSRTKEILNNELNAIDFENNWKKLDQKNCLTERHSRNLVQKEYFLSKQNTSTIPEDGNRLNLYSTIDQAQNHELRLKQWTKKYSTTNKNLNPKEKLVNDYEFIISEKTFQISQPNSAALTPQDSLLLLKFSGTSNFTPIKKEKQKQFRAPLPRNVSFLKNHQIKENIEPIAKELVPFSQNQNISRRNEEKTFCRSAAHTPTFNDFSSKNKKAFHINLEYLNKKEQSFLSVPRPQNLENYAFDENKFVRELSYDKSKNDKSEYRKFKF